MLRVENTSQKHAEDERGVLRRQQTTESRQGSPVTLIGTYGHG